MSLEQELYDKFVDVLNLRLDSEPSAQDLNVVLNFLKYNNIQATNKHKGVANLTEKAKTILPFDCDDEDSDVLPFRSVK